MTPKKNLPLLMNLAYVGYNRGLEGDFRPTIENGVLVTHCNQFINYVLNGMGYGDMTNMSANQMVDFMSKYENGWISPPSEDVIQTHANNGVIVIAGTKGREHGHVCLILPGILEKSGTWEKSVPKCVNIGRDVFFGKKLSFAFPANDQPTYFCMAGMI